MFVNVLKFQTRNIFAPLHIFLGYNKPISARKIKKLCFKEFLRQVSYKKRVRFYAFLFDCFTSSPPENKLIRLRREIN